MSDGTNPVTSPAPAASEVVASDPDATMAKQTIETNGTSASDDVAESKQEVAPDPVAPVEGTFMFSNLPSYVLTSYSY